MDRRQFLRLTGGSAAAAALAAWLVPELFREVGPVATPEEPVQAPEPGSPLLAILVPKDELEGDKRGHAIGALLHHGGEQVLADLAGVELVCARADQVPAELRAAAEGEPWFVLLTRNVSGARAHAFTPNLPPEPPEQPPEGELLATTLQDLEAERIARVWVFADALHTFLATHVRTAAAEVFPRAALTRRRYVDKPPPGAHWANELGCGINIEGVPNGAPTFCCGMGMVPRLSARFLHFYVRG